MHCRPYGTIEMREKVHYKEFLVISKCVETNECNGDYLSTNKNTRLCYAKHSLSNQIAPFKCRLQKYISLPDMRKKSKVLDF